MADRPLPAAPKRIPGLPSNFRLQNFDGYDGLNTKPTRQAIKDQQCFILDNWMPLGKSNARTLYDAGTALAHVDATTGVLTSGPVPSGSFAALGVHFDGATVVSSPSLTTTDNAFMSFSLWFNDTNPAPNYWTHWVVDPAGGYISNDEVFTDASYGIVVANASFSNVLRDKSVVNTITYGSWHNVTGAVNTNFAAGLKVHNLFLDDVDISAVIQDVDGAFVMAFNGLPFFVNSDTNFNTIGDMAEFWMAPGQFIDFTVTANRRKFVTAGLQPVDLGSDGSTPTGTAPAIYLSRRTGDPASAFATNRGTGGAFTVSSGSLTASATDP